MTTLDCLEVWWLSTKGILSRWDVDGTFKRSSPTISNPSCSLTLRNEVSEADLVIWESGEGELGVLENGGQVALRHLENLKDPATMAAALSEMVKRLTE